MSVTKYCGALHKKIKTFEESGLMFTIIVRPELLNVSSVHPRFCILLGAQTADYKKIIIEKYECIGYRNRP